MLVLSRTEDESIVVPSVDLEITVIEVRGKQVRLALSAPREVAIYRKEVQQRIEAEQSQGEVV